MTRRKVEAYGARRESREAGERPARRPVGLVGWGHTRTAARSCAYAGLIGLATLFAGCSLDGLLNSDELPADITDPAIFKTPKGALAAYYGTIKELRTAFGGGTMEPGFVALGGVLTDELQSNLQPGNTQLAADIRHLPEGEETDKELSSAFGPLQRVRGQATQAIGLLTRYAPEHRALTGHAYALRGYAEIFLAELYCSGIPLSTLDFEGDYTYRPGSTTDVVFETALAALDSALALAADSAGFLNLARVGRARALLGLGRIEDAAAAVEEVPTDFRYELQYSVDDKNVFNTVPSNLIWRFTVADRQGLNGLDYRTSKDPRTPTTLLGTSARGTIVYFPNRYATNGSSSITMASGIEARLIEAEAALRTGGNWLGLLNALRTDGTFTVQPNQADPVQMDTVWNAGSGGVAGLAPLTDPGGADARIDLVFRERAFWLFLTGHRQGDLRRLVRHYGRAQEKVYPVGVYPGITGASFGGHIELPIPQAERVSNPMFTGCAARGA